jgi:hypothetical protein
MSDILERLRGYNPPDRTIASDKQTAIDIADAIVEIERLQRFEKWYNDAVALEDQRRKDGMGRL